MKSYRQNLKTRIYELRIAKLVAIARLYECACDLKANE